MKTIGIYPGNFQPPHEGHYKAYLKLKNTAGQDTYVVTTDYDPSIDAPLHFGDKEQILVRHGVDDSHIKKVKNLNAPWEVLDNHDPLTTIVIYGLNAQEALKKVKSSQYYEYFLGAQGQLKPFKQRVYIFVIDDNIRSKDKSGNIKIYTSENIREALGSHRYTNEQKSEWFKKFFGWFDLGLFELLKNKYTNAHQSADGSNLSVPDIKEELKKEICKILNELISSPPSIATDSSYGDNNSIATDTQSDTQNRADATKQKQDLVHQKQAAERDLDGMTKDLKWKQSDVIRKRKDELPAKRDELDRINQQIAQASHPTSATTSTTSY